MFVRDTILDLFPLGIAAVTAAGEVVLSNRVARDLLKDGRLLAIRDGKLIAIARVCQKALSDAIGNASRKAAPRSSGFSVARQGQPPISISVVPFHRGNGAWSQRGPRRALVLISDPTCAFDADPTIIAGMFDFTSSEALIAGHLLDGEDAAEIARRLNLSAYTVRNHLKRLYSKTNTRKHCELLHLLLRSPATLQTRQD